MSHRFLKPSLSIAVGEERMKGRRPFLKRPVTGPSEEEGRRGKEEEGREREGVWEGGRGGGRAWFDFEMCKCMSNSASDTSEDKRLVQYTFLPCSHTAIKRKGKKEEKKQTSCF